MKKILLLSLFILPLKAFSVCEGTNRTFNTIDPTTQQSWAVKTHPYLPQKVVGQKSHAVFIIPTILGETELDRGMAKFLCINGISSYIIDLIKDPPFDDQVKRLIVHDEQITRGHAAFNSVLSQLVTDPSLSGKFGIIGSSQGAIAASYLSGVEPLLIASVAIVGGGDLPSILAYSDQESIEKLREARYQNFGFSDPETYKDALIPMIGLDPINVVSAAAPGQFFVVVGTKDTTVPTQNQQQLVGGMSSPKVIEVSADHQGTIVAAHTVYADQIKDFFLDKFR